MISLTFWLTNPANFWKRFGSGRGWRFGEWLGLRSESAECFPCRGCDLTLGGPIDSIVCQFASAVEEMRVSGNLSNWGLFIGARKSDEPADGALPLTRSHLLRFSAFDISGVLRKLAIWKVARLCLIRSIASLAGFVSVENLGLRISNGLKNVANVLWPGCDDRRRSPTAARSHRHHGR